MAHTVNKVVFGNTALAQVTFTNYTRGGEQFTLAEFGLTGSLVGMWFLRVFDQQLGEAPVPCRYVGGGIVKLVLPDLNGVNGAGVEMPTTASMSLTVFVIVQGS